jgi:hypothetical protein
VLEQVDATYLPRLLSRRPDFFQRHDEPLDTQTFQAIRSWLREHTLNSNGVTTRYRSKKDFLRLYSVDNRNRGKPSLQSVRGVVRTLLAGNLYHDLDIVNCQPSILLHLASEHGLTCLEALHAYVQDKRAVRAKIAEELNCSVEVAKTQLLCCLNSATLHPDAGQSLTLREIFFNGQLIQQTFWELPQYRRIRNYVQSDGDQTNAKGRFISLVFQSVERRVLLTAKEYLEQNGYQVGALIHDGLLVKRGAFDPALLCEDLSLAVKSLAPLTFEEKLWTLNEAVRELEEAEAREVEIEEEDRPIQTLDDFNRYAENWRQVGHEFYHIGDKVSYTLQQLRVNFIQHKELFEEWLTDPQRPKYDGFACIPPTLPCPKNRLNVWKPYLQLEEHELVQEAVDMFKFHCEKLTSGNAEHYKWLLMLVKHALVYPEEKAPMVILYGNQGEGKGLFMNVLRKLYRYENCVSFKSLDDICGHFAGDLLNRGPQLISEEWNIQSHKRYQNELKNLLTETWLPCNRKHFGNMNIQSFHRVWGCSNSLDGFPFPTDDRRLIVMEAEKGGLSGDFIRRYVELTNSHDGIQSILSFILSDEVEVHRRLYSKDLPIPLSCGEAEVTREVPKLTRFVHAVLENADHIGLDHSILYQDNVFREPARFWRKAYETFSSWVGIDSEVEVNAMVKSLRRSFSNAPNSRPHPGFTKKIIHGERVWALNVDYWKKQFEDHGMDVEVLGCQVDGMREERDEALFAQFGAL